MSNIFDEILDYRVILMNELDYEMAYWDQMEDLYYWWILALHSRYWVPIDPRRCLFPIVARCKRP